MNTIAKIDISLGNVNIFVGSDRGILAQICGLYADSRSIVSTLKLFGYVHKGNYFAFNYFGEGYERALSFFPARINGVTINPDTVAPQKGERIRERVLFIPAQRAMELAYGYGWPMCFQGFVSGVPYSLRKHSEEARMMLDEDFWRYGQEVVFPSDRVPGVMVQLANTIYEGANLVIDETTRKQLKLEKNGIRAPIHCWSVSQREFTPLLLGFYCLFPPRQKYEWVIIEEPEIGMEPSTFNLMALSILHLLLGRRKIIVTSQSGCFVQTLWQLAKEEWHYALEQMCAPCEGRGALRAPSVQLFYVHEGIVMTLSSPDALL